MDYKKLPKIELHLHLDCSLSYKVVKQIKPSISFEDYQDTFIAPPKCIDLSDYLRRSIKGFELMQTKEQLRLVTLDLFEQLKADHVIYAEIRFAPFLHTMNGLTAGEVVEVVNNATEEALQSTGIDAGIILCTLRHYTESQSMETVQLVKQFEGTHIVGYDIAADEAGFPIDEHIKSFQFANQNHINCTAHAGEARGADSVWETLKNFNPKRIGHGVRSIEDTRLLNHLKDKNIHLEICPTSNIQTNVFNEIKNHPIDKFFKAGISVSINTDSKTISNVTLTEEYETLERAFNWDESHMKACNLSAIEYDFTTEDMKTKLRKKIEEAYT